MLKSITRISTAHRCILSDTLLNYTTRICRHQRQINTIAAPAKVPNLIVYHGIWPSDVQRDFQAHMRVMSDFISETEEHQLIEEVEPYMKRLRYEFDHWDDAIHGFRETERKKWYPHNRNVLERVRTIAFDGEIMPYVHVLDLAAEGVIKPHVDSTRYCGTTISGISLLTDCVMRLVRTNPEIHKQNNISKSDTKTESESAVASANDVDEYRSQPRIELENNYYADLFLPRRSLYIMSHSARYNFTHEILSNERATFEGKPITKTRRISIICRNDPS